MEANFRITPAQETKEKYCYQPTVTPGTHHFDLALKEALSHLSNKYPGAISPDDQTTLVLGGLTSFFSSVDSLKELCENFHPKNNQYFVVNESCVSLSLVDHPLKAQAQLDKLPLRENLADLVFLYFTTDLMDDHQLPEFAKSLGKILKPNGLALSLSHTPALDISLADHPFVNFWMRAMASWRNKAPSFYRSSSKLNRLMAPLKPILLAETDYDSLSVYSRPDSWFSPHEGSKYAYYKYLLS